MRYGDAAKALGHVSFDRPRRESDAVKPSEVEPITRDESIFAGTLIDPVTGKIASGRPAWEAAGRGSVQGDWVGKPGK